MSINRSWLAYGVRAALCALVAVASSGASAAAPRLQVERTEVDLGELVKGEVTEARFRYENTGDAVLQIIRVKPG